MKEIQILLYGLENSGKSTLIESFKRGKFCQGMPLTAQTVTEFSLEDDKKFTIIEIGGRIEVRHAVNDWLDHIQAIIYCIDGSDEDKFIDVVQEFKKILNDPRTVNKPLVIVFNKKDVAKVHPSFIIDQLGMMNRYDRPHQVFSMSAKEPQEFKKVLDWIYERLNEDRFPIEDKESRFLTIFILDMLEVSKAAGLPLLAILGQLEIISRTGQIDFNRDKILSQLRKLREEGFVVYFEPTSVWKITDKGLRKLKSSELIKGSKFEKMKALLDSKKQVDSTKKKEILDEFDLDELAEIYDKTSSSRH